ncbi:hypothetical protein BDR03DRAFT_727813 [Suillus americanus]|nr:hypothetical protein BDR03DRAFT_727813 [Suillus americanus]
MFETNYINSQFKGSVPTIAASHPVEMLHSNRQTFPTYRKGNDVDRSSEFLGRPGSQHRPKLKNQLVSQTIDARSDGDKEASLLPLVWVEVRDNIIPPHAVPFASDSHGPLFIARAYLEGTFFLGKAGPQLTSGAVISYGSLDITVTRYDVLVCASQLSWEIPHSSGTGFMRRDTVVTKYTINHDLKPALMYHQDIPENAHNLAGIHNRVDNNQRSATLDPDPDPDLPIVASHNRTRPLAHSNSRYGHSSNESLDVDIWKAHDAFVPLKSPLELTERSRSLPPRARTSSFDARAELGTFRCDSAQSASVATIVSATHRPEYAPASRPSVVASPKPQIRLDCVSQESYKLPAVVSAVEYSASERGTPVGSFGQSEVSGLREVANADGWSKYSTPPPESPAQSVHAGVVQDVIPLRRYPNTGITASTSVSHHTNPTSATSHFLASNVADSRFAKFYNPSPKDNSQFTPAHYSFSSHKMSSDSSLPQPSTVLSRGVRADTPESPVLCFCTPDDVNGTSKFQPKLANCLVHPSAHTIGISVSSVDFGHVDQYDQRARPVTQAHVWQRGAQHQKYQSKDGPSRVPQPLTFPFTDSPPAQSSLVGDHADVDLRLTQYSHHGVPKSLAETSSEDGNTTASDHMCGCDSEHVCDSEHWQLVSRTTLGVEAQTCDGAECDAVASELPAPITVDPLNAGIATSEVQHLPAPHVTSVPQITRDSGQGHSEVAVQESTLEPELVQENIVAVTAASKTTSTGELTSDIPCRGTLMVEDCVPLLAVACTPSSPPSRRESTQTVSCSDSSVTDDKLHRHHEYPDSSDVVCAYVAPEENDISTPTQSSVIAVEHTQKSNPASNDLRGSPFNKNTLTMVESLALTANRHEELYGQDVVRDKPSTEVSSTPKLDGVDEDVSTDRKRQTVESREDHHEQGTESEAKSNLTSYSHTVRIVEGHASKDTILNDRQVNEGADGAALSLSPSERGVPQDSGVNRIESGYEHRSSDVDTFSKSSAQISSHDSTESSEGSILRQSREEVNSSVLVPVSLAPAETIGAPVPAPRRAIENTQKSSLAFDDLRDSSLPEDTWTMGQTSSSVTDLKGGSCGHTVGTDLPTQSSPTPNICVEHDKLPVSADCMHQVLEDRGDYHAREAESDIILKSESCSSRSDVDTDSDNSSLSSTYTERQLSLSEPGVPQDAGIHHIQSAREHQSSEINVTSTTLVQTSSHRSIEHGVQSSLVTVQGGPCGQNVTIDQPCQRLSAPKPDNNELAECVHQAVESGGGRHELETESEFQLNSTTHSHSVGIVERSASETVVLKVDRKMDEDTEVSALPSSPMTTLPPSDPSILQDAGTHFIQPGRQHQSSVVDIASIVLVQTSSQDRMTESEGYQPAQSFSGCDEPEATLPAQVCLPLARDNSNTPSSMDENRVVVTAVSQTTSTGEFTLAVPCCGTLIAEECVPLSTVTCTPILPPSRQESTQIIACIDSSVTDNKLNIHCECTESSVLDCASVALEETDISTPTRSRVIAVEHTQTSSPASDDVRNSSFNRSTLTTVESHPLTANRHEEPYGQDVTRDRLSEVSSTPRLEGGEEDVSTDRKRQTVEGREDHHEIETESEVKSNLTSYSCTVRIIEGYTSKSTISDDDGRVNEGADGAALSSINPGSKISPSERAVPQDSAANHIESEYERQSSDIDTVSKSSIQVSGHDSTESSEGHIQRQDCEEVDSSVVVQVSLAPAETIGTPAPAPCRAVEITQKSSLASNDLRNSSLPEDTWTMGQTSSLVTDLEDGSSSHIVDTDLPTQCSSYVSAASCLPH